MTIYALIAPRATFLQLIPYLSVLPIFATFTAGSPVFVWSSSLVDNLPPGIVRDPFGVARKIAQEEFDRLWDVKQQESTEESYTIRKSESELAEMTPQERKDMETKNAISRQRQQLVLQEGKFVVREWEIFLNGVILFLTGSRYINYARGVLNWTLAVLLLYTDDSWNKTLGIISFVGMLPFAVAMGLEFCVAVGRSLWITDEELYREYGWLWRLGQCLGCFRPFHSPTSTPATATSARASASAIGGLSETAEVSDEIPDQSAAGDVEMSDRRGADVVNPVLSMLAPAIAPLAKSAGGGSSDSETATNDGTDHPTVSERIAVGGKPLGNSPTGRATDILK